MKPINHKIIEFKQSKTGTPYIQIGDFGRLIFSNITSHHKKGYKYMCFSHTYVEKIRIKNTVGLTQTIEIPTHDSYSINMFLEKESKTHKGLPHNTLPIRMKDYLKNNITPLLDKEGYLSYKNINILKDKIHNQEIKSILNSVQKKK